MKVGRKLKESRSDEVEVLPCAKMAEEDVEDESCW